MSNYNKKLTHPLLKWEADYIESRNMYKITFGGSFMGELSPSGIYAFGGWEKVEEAFKEGSWYYFETGDIRVVVRNKRVEDNKFWCSEAYGIGYDDCVLCWKDTWYTIEFIKGPATQEQMELCLGHVARHKGYKEGVVVNGVLLGIPRPIRTNELFYRADFDSLYFKSDKSPNDPSMVYCKGTWATIIEEKATEPQVDADMGQDWKTAKVFSYEELGRYPRVKVGTEEAIVINSEHLEEEAKKRTNA